MKLKFLITLGLTICYTALAASSTSLQVAQATEAKAIERAKIITDDNVTVAYTQEMSKLIFLNKFTKDEFSKLLDKLSTVLHINKAEKITRYFSESNKNLNYQVISYSVTKENAPRIKKIIAAFIRKNGLNPKKKYYQFELSGERRVYPYNNFLTPVIGYCRKLENKGLTYIKGVKGIENYYDSQLTFQSNRPKDIHLTINFDLQKELEKQVFLKKVDIDADEVISIIINPKTYNIKAFASSNRFNPKKIRRYDMSSLNISAVEKLFDIGHYMKPIKDAIENEKSLKLVDGYKKFGFYDKSGIDLNYEKISKNTLDVNLIQLLKMYTVFYSDGKIACPNIAKHKDPKLFEQIISKENAQKIKEKMQSSLKKMRDTSISMKGSNTRAYVSLKEIKVDSKEYLQLTLTINPKNNYYSDEVEQVNMPDDFPYIVIHTYAQGSSSQLHRYIIYSKKSTNIKIGEVKQPINKWQANNGEGSEKDVQGFYQDKHGNYYIDKITTKGTVTASCNACQIVNIETLQLTDQGLVPVNLRRFNLKTYKPLVKK